MWKWLYSWFESVLCLLGIHDYEMTASKDIQRYEHGENARYTLRTGVCLRPECRYVWDQIGDDAKRESDRAQKLARRREEAIKKYEAVK